jgi:uncharacterized protein YgbK (DUF1537 family)
MSQLLLLGCIADDFTGATDLANNLVRSGMRTVQFNGIPTKDLPQNVDAVVIALKSRTIAAQDAIEQSLAALAWLRQHHAKQIYFKYCSTFDSTAKGNIGPVIDALMDELASDFTVATPAFPDTGRTVFKGHLFVGDALLSDSGMQHHPLTPMADANLLRVLQSQSKRKVGLIDYTTITDGAEAIRDRIQTLREQGVGIAIVDAISNDDLMRLGQVIGNMPLVTAGSGVAMGLSQNFGLQHRSTAGALPPAKGHRAVLSGSCSIASNQQVQHFKQTGHPTFEINPQRIAQGEDLVAEILAWATPLLGQTPLLIYSTASVDSVQSAQNELGVQFAGALVEDTLAHIACGLVQAGVRQLLVAGGETSGACLQALEVVQMQIGFQVDPGVPWCFAQSKFAGKDGLHLTLKSGNFGSDDFFSKAFKVLE